MCSPVAHDLRRRHDPFEWPPPPTTPLNESERMTMNHAFHPAPGRFAGTLACVCLLLACTESVPMSDAGTSLGAASGSTSEPDVMATGPIDRYVATPDHLTDAAADFDQDDSEGDGGAELMLSGPTTILLITDKSGSMGGGWDGQSKWSVGNEAVLSALVPFRKDLTLGAIIFPIGEACDVPELDAPGQYPFTDGTRFVNEWTQSFPTISPSGSTPLALAFEAADRAIDAAIADGLFEHKFKVMVVTDGEPTCGGDPSVFVDLPARWQELGVRTYVMGLPGSEPAKELLQSIAEAGGTEFYRVIGDPDQLQQDVAFAATE